MAAVPVIAAQELGPLSRPARPLLGRRTLAVCAAAVIAIEVADAFGGAIVASIGYAALIVLLVNYLAFAVRRGGAVAAEAAPVAMLLVPLCLRLAALTLEGGPVPLARHYALVGGTAVAALAYAAVAFPELRPRLELSAWRPGQVVVALCGLPIGLVCTLAFGRRAILPEHGLGRSTLVLLALALGAGATEELLFRGFLQTALGRLVGRLAPAAATAALLVAYLGARPVAFLFAAVALGFCSAVIVARSGRLEGVVVGRALLYSGLFVLWPSALHLH
jgi:membrane protease YdiL (CAAX protease family)